MICAICAVELRCAGKNVLQCLRALRIMRASVPLPAHLETKTWICAILMLWNMRIGEILCHLSPAGWFASVNGISRFEDNLRLIQWMKHV